MPRVDNDVIVLNTILEEATKQSTLKVGNDEVFQNFVFEQVLKNFDLSEDELDFGCTGGPSDGGIDGFFFFLNGELVQEDLDEPTPRRSPDLDLFVIQAKTSLGFQETVLEKFITTSQDILDLGKELGTLSNLYNDQLVERVRLFRESYRRLISTHPRLQITYVDACKGNTDTINSQFTNRVKQLKRTVNQLFREAKVHVDNLGAKELNDLYRVQKKYTLSLNFTENFSSAGAANYVVLSSLVDYYQFIIDDRKELRRYIFDANVRAFQGMVEVNKDITSTLKNEKNLDFWWLNNGITILASKATVAAKTMTIDDVQIINGLQTTTCLYNYFSERNPRGERIDDENGKRFILIKILVTDSENARDKIIKATNFQTSIAPASLKVTNAIHYRLEDYFKNNGWYYDRRKNYYKNLGKPRDRIISVPLMAQSMMSLVCKEPQTARARPASLVKKDSIYNRIFRDTISVEVYLFCAQVIKTLEVRLKTALAEFTNQEKTNLKFHIAMAIIMKKTGRVDYSLKDIEELSIDNIDEELIDSTARLVICPARDYMKANTVSLETMSKAKPFVEHIKKELKN